MRIFVFLIFLIATNISFSAYAEDSTARILYKDQFYGFQIEYPKNWVLKKINEDVRIIFSFEAPTQDLNWTKTRESRTAPIFEIQLYSYPSYKSEENLCKQQGNSSSYCLRLTNVYGKNDKYIFVVYDNLSAAFDAPNDFSYDYLTRGRKNLETLKIIEINKGLNKEEK
jgi:hypothetical protein